MRDGLKNKRGKFNAVKRVDGERVLVFDPDSGVRYPGPKSSKGHKKHTMQNPRNHRLTARRATAAYGMGMVWYILCASYRVAIWGYGKFPLKPPLETAMGVNGRCGCADPCQLAHHDHGRNDGDDLAEDGSRSNQNNEIYFRFVLPSVKFNTAC